MADIIPSLQIDDDWKRQAQEEKRKLAEAEAAKKAQAAAAPAVTAAGGGAGNAPGAAGSGRRSREEVPAASLAALVQTLMTQALFYLGEIGNRSGQTTLDLDMAKMQVDLLGVLEEKTKGNVTPEETHMIDSALYETRLRFVAVAREYADLSGGR